MEIRTNKAGYLESDTHRQCTNCREMFKRTSKDTMKICPKCNNARVKCLSAEYKMRNRAQQRAKNSRLEFNLELSDINIPNVCPVLGVPLVAHSGSSGGHKYSPSLDRIDPTRGYIKNNVRVISHLANQMKSHADVNEMRKFAKWILNEHPE